MTKENINWVIIIFAILIVVFLWNNYRQKKRIQKFKDYLISSWGKQIKNRYYNFYSISKYFENTFNRNNSFHIIDNATANDLDIDDLFKYIDRTSSKIGQQYLYYKLRTIQFTENLKEFDKLTNLFENDVNLRLLCQLKLSKLNTHSAYDFETLINEKPIEKPNYLKYLSVLSFISLISIFASFFKIGFILILLPVFALNIVFHYKNKQNVNYYLSGVGQLLSTLKVSKLLSKQAKIKPFFKDLSFLDKVQEIRMNSEFISFDNKFDNPFAVVLWLFIEIIKIQFNVGTILFYKFIDGIYNEKESLDKMFQFIGKIDSAIAIASVKYGNNQICKPQFTTDKLLKAKEIYHPLIENCITNTIELNHKSLLLTGSNMSGKTTFIRTIAINTILAQTMNIAFAKEFKIPFLKVFSSIKISDDLLNDTSYYLKEVQTIKKFIEESKGNTPCLFVLDEIFKGTNTIERISGGKAILSYLNLKNHFVLVSTHDIELTDLLKNKAYDLYHFTEIIIDNKLIFDHKLKQGKLLTRNAIKILELNNYPKEIIIDAKKVEKDNF